MIDASFASPYANAAEDAFESHDRKDLLAWACALQAFNMKLSYASCHYCGAATGFNLKAQAARRTAHTGTAWHCTERKHPRAAAAVREILVLADHDSRQPWSLLVVLENVWTVRWLKSGAARGYSNLQVSTFFSQGRSWASFAQSLYQCEEWADSEGRGPPKACWYHITLEYWDLSNPAETPSNACP